MKVTGKLLVHIAQSLSHMESYDFIEIIADEKIANMTTIHMDELRLIYSHFKQSPLLYVSYLKTEQAERLVAHLIKEYQEH